MPMETWEPHCRDLRFRQYDDIRIIYQGEPGKTHFLNATTALILDIVTDRPSTIAEVCRALAGEAADSVTNEDLQLIEAHMARLDVLGLVQRSAATAAAR